MCILRRMPRMQVYLPEPLHKEAKSRNLPVSELLQEAIRVEVRRRELREAGADHLSDLLAEVGEPAPADSAWAQDLARRLARRADRAAS